MNQKLKVSFVNPPHADWCLTNVASWMFFKSHLDRMSFGSRIEWIEPPIKYNAYQTVDEIVEELIDCDVVLFSSYVWNYDLCDQIAAQFRVKKPETILMLGGPHIGLNDMKFFNSRPEYNYICLPTKPGEAFLESLFKLYFENLEWPDPNVIDWEIRSKKGLGHPLPNYSIYREHLEFLKKMRSYADENSLEPFVILESTRGCPHGCVYCEWGGGTNSRIVAKPISIVKEDILSLKEAGFNAAYLTDANFGIFESRDLEIFKFAHEHKFALTDISTMKSKNLESRKRLVDLWFDAVGADISSRIKEDKTVRTQATWGVDTEYLASSPTVSIQSISEEAMKVAQRSDLNLAGKISLSDHIRQRCEKEGFEPPPLELILAMPGSTLDDFYNEFTIIWNFKAWSSFRHDYMFLPDSLTTSPAYLEKYQIELVDVYSDLVDEAGVDNVYTLYGNKKTFFKTVRASYSFNYPEFREMFFMNSAGNYLLKNFYPVFKEFMQPSEFGRLCYRIIVQLDSFEPIYLEIDDIFNPLTPPRSIKKINGRLRTTVINEFLERNKPIILNELFRSLGSYGNNRADITT